MNRVAEVRIGRLHARYHQVDSERSLALDRALGDLAVSGLDDVLADAVGPELGRAWAVCIPEVTVEVVLRAGGVAAWTSAWAAAVGAAVEAALVGASGSQTRAEHRVGEDGVTDVSGLTGVSDGGEVVVFATRGDGLVDLVRRTACGDRRNVWAWRQAGLGTDVVAALRAEPLLVPGVLRAVGPELFGLVVAPAELADLAGAVAGATSSAGRSAVTRGSAAALSALMAASIAALPHAGHRWAPASAAASGTDGPLHDLALLATLAAAPVHSADPALLHAVATALAGSPVDTAPGPRPVVAPGPAAKPDGEVTDWGGVWFLAHALPAVVDGLVPASGAADLALLVATFTGAPYDDPSVRLLCGLTDDPLDPLDPRDSPAAASEPDRAALAALTSWLDERIDEPDRLWRRTARIRQRPGETEVEYSLSDVDPLVRRAGLDLDPDWVGWLGSFVRFRYV